MKPSHYQLEMALMVCLVSACQHPQPLARFGALVDDKPSDTTTISSFISDTAPTNPVIPPNIGPGTPSGIVDYYMTAVQEVASMLSGKTELSFKRAVFLTENAYYGGTLDWLAYCAEIDRIESRLKEMILDKNLGLVRTAANWAVFTYMTDSIPENNYAPYQYDLENFMGDSDYESFMVTRLLQTRKGNCHSLPYLYKILADEMGAEACLALAPMHVFIKHRDEDGKWWNLELTSGTFSRTSFIIESFGVTDAGMQSGLYMKPLSTLESVALCLSDLIDYYEKTTGKYSGSLVEAAYNSGLRVYPNSLLQLQKYNDLKDMVDSEMLKRDLKTYDQAESVAELSPLCVELEKTAEHIEQMGYYQLSADDYEVKVNEMISQKTKQ